MVTLIFVFLICKIAMISCSFGLIGKQLNSEARPSKDKMICGQSLRFLTEGAVIKLEENVKQ